MDLSEVQTKGEGGTILIAGNRVGCGSEFLITQRYQRTLSGLHRTNVVLSVRPTQTCTSARLFNKGTNGCSSRNGAISHTHLRKCPCALHILLLTIASFSLINSFRDQLAWLWGLDLSLRLSFEALQSRLEKEKKTEHATRKKYSPVTWTQFKWAT